MSIEVTVHEPAYAPAASRATARRITLLLLSAAAAWMAIVAVACRVAVGWEGWSPIRPRYVEATYIAMQMHGVAAGVLVALLLMIRRQRGVSPWLPRVGLLFGMLLILASVDRIAGAFVPPGQPLDPLVCMHPERGYSLQPNAIRSGLGRTLRTNSLGFRGEPIEIPKPTDEFRILFLGDSVTFGFRLKGDETIAPVTEDALKGRSPHGRRVRCQNAGVIGYAGWQELNLLRHEGRRAQPDLVVLTYCPNDLTDISLVGRGALKGIPGQFSTGAGQHWSGLARAAGVWAARRRERLTMDRNFWNDDCTDPWKDPLDVKEIEASYVQPLHPRFVEAWEVVLADLSAMHDAATDMGAEFVVLYATPSLEFRPDARYLGHRNRLRAWAREHGVLFIDPTALLRDAVRDRGEAAIMLDVVHPSAEGVRILSSCLVDELDRAGMLR